MNHESLSPQVPAAALELLSDPRTADLEYLGPGLPNDRRVLKPTNPPTVGESRFLLFSPYPEDSSNARIDWLNKPEASYALAARGLEMLGPETPRFREARKKPKALPEAWFYLGVVIASPRVAAIMTKFEPGIQTVSIDWTFADGGRLDGYVFLDIHRAIPAYDYGRSEVLVERDKTRKFVAGLGMVRALRRDIDLNIHAFREAFNVHEIFISREMAAALYEAGLELNLLEPATMQGVRLFHPHLLKRRSPD